jgi:hypothetical protein
MQLKNSRLILVIVAWFVLTLVNYYYVPYYLLPFIWLALCVILLVVLGYQFIMLIKERRCLRTKRVAKFAVFLLLFFLTINRSTTEFVIEKADWIMLKSKRTEIVKQVIERKLNPNTTLNNGVCQLPFEFPIVSNGGNDILIDRDGKNGKTTITFWIFRNYFEAPSTRFVYTDNPEEITIIEKALAANPQDNWKISENWYRTYRE